MRGANGVAAEFLQFFHPEVLQGIRQGRADARVVLVIARALDDIGFAVEQKTLFRIKRDGANAELIGRSCVIVALTLTRDFKND